MRCTFLSYKIAMSPLENIAMSHESVLGILLLFFIVILYPNLPTEGLITALFSLSPGPIRVSRDFLKWESAGVRQSEVLKCTKTKNEYTLFYFFSLYFVFAPKKYLVEQYVNVNERCQVCLMSNFA